MPRVCVDHLHVRQRLVRLTSRHGRCVVRFVTVGSVVDNVAFLIGWVVYKELSALRPYSVKTALLLHSDSPRERELAVRPGEVQRVTPRAAKIQDRFSFMPVYISRRRRANTLEISRDTRLIRSCEREYTDSSCENYNIFVFLSQSLCPRFPGVASFRNGDPERRTRGTTRMWKPYWHRDDHATHQPCGPRFAGFWWVETCEIERHTRKPERAECVAFRAIARIPLAQSPSSASSPLLR